MVSVEKNSPNSLYSVAAATRSAWRWSMDRLSRSGMESSRGVEVAAGHREMSVISAPAGGRRDSSVMTPAQRCA